MRSLGREGGIMTIDPLTIPCPFCGNSGNRKEFLTEDWEMVVEITCFTCEMKVSTKDWITGGINALVGKLARQGIRIEDKSYGETPSWAWVTDEIWVKRGSFEEAVWDAWEKMKP